MINSILIAVLKDKHQTLHRSNDHFQASVNYSIAIPSMQSEIICAGCVNKNFAVISMSATILKLLRMASSPFNFICRIICKYILRH